MGIMQGKISERGNAEKMTRRQEMILAWSEIIAFYAVALKIANTNEEREEAIAEIAEGSENLELWFDYKEEQEGEI